jgi:hypothetical protein
VAPAIGITNVGLDSNVFNEATDPKSDITATVAPSAQLWLRMGRAQVSGNTRLDAIFFKQYTGQGTVSTMNSGRLDFAFNRVRPFVSGSFLRLHDRPSPEIDVRAQRIEQAVTAGVAVRLAPRTSARVAITRNSVTFGDAGIGTSLGQELDRSQQLRTVGLQYELTPLTMLLVDVQQEHTRFKSASDRNANGIRLFPGLIFKPTALVGGDVHVGYLTYTPEDPRVPRFSGIVAAVNVRSIIAGVNEVSVAIERDLSHSVEAQVYYVLTRASVTMTRQLNRRWSVSGSVSRQWLGYSSVVRGGAATATDGASALDLVTTRPDTVTSAGLGVGFRLTDSARMSLAAGYAHRDAELASGRYDNLRSLASVTYAVR